MKPELAAAAGRFLHVPQHLGPTPYAVSQQGLTYADLDAEDFARPSWRLRLDDNGAAEWGSHVFKVGPDGALTFHSQAWDTSD